MKLLSLEEQKLIADAAAYEIKVITSEARADAILK